MSEQRSHTSIEPRAPLAEFHANRRTGHAIVRVIRKGRTRRYRVTLRRYAALRNRLTECSLGWLTSGAWLRSGLHVYVWERRS